MDRPIFTEDEAGRRTLVPRVVGRTERTRAAKGETSRALAASPDDRIGSEMGAPGEPFATAASRLIALWQGLGGSAGPAKANNLWMSLRPDGSRPSYPMMLRRTGRIEFWLVTSHGWPVLPTRRRGRLG